MKPAKCDERLSAQIDPLRITANGIVSVCVAAAVVAAAMLLVTYL